LIIEGFQKTRILALTAIAALDRNFQFLSLNFYNKEALEELSLVSKRPQTSILCFCMR
jgi:hypothetical protein